MGASSLSNERVCKMHTTFIPQIESQLKSRIGGDTQFVNQETDIPRENRELEHPILNFNHRKFGSYSTQNGLEDKGHIFLIDF